MTVTWKKLAYTDTDHGGLTGLGDDDHPQYIRHALATAVNDFLVASGAGAYVKKTLAETKTILGLLYILEDLDFETPPHFDDDSPPGPWQRVVQAGGVGSIYVTSGEGGNVLIFDITDGGPYYYCFQLVQDIPPLRINDKYSIILRARAGGNRTIIVKYMQKYPPGADVSNTQTLNLTSNWQVFRFGLTISADEAIPVFYIGAGANDSSVYIDEIFQVLAVDHGGLDGLADDDHTQYIKHSLATAVNDFLVGVAPGPPDPSYFEKKTLAETLTILGKGAASGLASLDASTVVVEAVKLLKAGTGALAETDGAVQWQSTRKLQLIYDTQRERAASAMGWLPYAYQIGAGPADLPTTTFSLTGQNIAIAFPVILEASMLLESVTIRQTHTQYAKTWRWGLYEQYLNNGNAAENTLTLIASCGDTNFTPTAPSNETAAATGAPIYLPPGIYWLVIQNRHASNLFRLGTQVAGTMALNTAQMATLEESLPATLDFGPDVNGWVYQNCLIGARLNGRVFGMTTAF